MAVLQLVRTEVGEVGVKPGKISMLSTDNLSTITTAGYLNGTGNQLKQVLLSPTDVVECMYSYNASTGAASFAILLPTISGGVITLTAWDNPGIEPLAQNQIFVGNASNAATAVALSGDATIVASGALTIANLAVNAAKLAADAVTTAKILNSNVTLAKLASGITPSHVIKYAGQPTTVGGAAAEAFTVTGAAATDLAFVQIVNDGTANVTVLQAVVTLNTLTVTFSANPGADTIFNYQIIRAAA